MSPLLDLSKVDRVPVTVVSAIMDGLCPTELADWFYNQINSPEKYIWFEKGGHGAPGSKGHEAHIRRMVQTIENGVPDPDDPSRGPFLNIILQRLAANIF